MVVPKESATMGHERAMALNGNHLRIAKFESCNDSNFKVVSENLIMLMKEVDLRRREKHLV
jgi:hypothetical protein